MLVLVHNSPTTLEPYRSPDLGVLCSPRRFYEDSIQSWPWAADNDAFSNWDPGRFRAMLEAIRGRTGCLFVAAPDVVGDYLETTRRFFDWRAELDGFPVAFIGQDDQERHGVPWEMFDAFFVGGTTDWKLGPGAARLVLEAKSRGKWVHMGRVNSFSRARYAYGLGCDSFDGSKYGWFRDTRLPPILRELRLAREYEEARA